jgi:POT family proton-dependent oligopeptide transporter
MNSTQHCDHEHRQKHSSGLFKISFSASLFCISFGLIASLLVLYLTQVMGFTEKQAYALFGAYFSLIFALPVIGGYLGSYFGSKRSMFWANFLLIMGSGLLAFSQNHIQLVYLGLAFFASGTAIYAPTYLTLQGKLYARNDHRRESAYTLSYVITNLGFLISSVMAGYIQKYFDYHICFLLGALISLVPLALFYFLIRPIEAHQESSLEPLTKLSSGFAWLGLIISSLILVGACLFLLEHANLNNILLIILASLGILVVLYLAFTRESPKDRARLFIFVLLSVLSVGFWTVYTLEPSLLTIFVQNNVDRKIFGFEIPAPVFYGLNPFFIVTVGLGLSYLWVYLRNKGKDFSLSAKFTFSLSSLVVGLLLLAGLIWLTGEGNLLNLWWIVLVYFFLTLAELLISPIGQAMVGRLAPEGFEGGLMGVWQMFCGLSAALSGFLAQWFNVPEKATLHQSNPIYMHGFLVMGGIALIMAVISFLLMSPIRRALNQN